MVEDGAAVRAEEARSRGPTFDYGSIPPGYYDRMLREGPPVQRAWHRQKFDRAIEALGPPAGGRMIDIGCGPGSFLGRLDPARFEELAGIDLAADQIGYANKTYGRGGRSFRTVGLGERWPFTTGRFDAGTLIEVIEHLYPDQIRRLMRETARVLKPGAALVVTTPNYASHWPVLEYLVGRFSEVSYEEQHVTRFTRYNVKRRIAELMGEWFTVELVTTSHFLAPFLAAFSGSVSDQVSEALTPRHWAWPFGVLLILRLRRRSE